MAKANNPRLQAQVTPELKKITDSMLKHLNMSQSQFFEKYLPVLFLSLDREKFFELYKEIYTVKELDNLLQKLKKAE